MIALVSVYMGLWIAFYFLTHASSGTRTNPAILVLMVETIKFFLAAVLRVVSSFRRRRRQQQQQQQQPKVQQQQQQQQQVPSYHVVRDLLVTYWPIAAIYCAYNNLVIYNLRYFDPTTYLVLASLRLILTALGWQWMFDQKITSIKWVALLLVTVGVLIKDIHQTSNTTSDVDGISVVDATEDATEYTGSLLWHVCLVGVQLACSVFGSVYNEKVLKTKVKHDPHLHNMCLYANSMVLNAIVMLMYSYNNNNNNNNNDAITITSSSSAPTTTTTTTLTTMHEIIQALTSVHQLAIIVALASAGIATSLLLRYIDSMAKSVASAAEPAVCAVLGALLWQQSLTWSTIGSITFIFAGTCLYTVPPNTIVWRTILSAATNTTTTTTTTTQHYCCAKNGTGGTWKTQKYRLFAWLALCVPFLTNSLSWVVTTSSVDMTTRELTLSFQNPALLMEGKDVSTNTAPPPPPPPLLLRDMESCLRPSNITRETDDTAAQKWQALQATVKVLDSVQAQYTVACGLLLGFVRECRMFDYDLDFMVEADSFATIGSDTLTEAFVQNGFTVNHLRYGLGGDLAALGGGFKLIYANVSVDIYIAVRSDSFVINALKYKKHLVACPKPMHHVERFAWRNIAVPVPMPHHDMLAATYGDDYMVPQHNKFLDRVYRALETGRCQLVQESKEYIAAKENQSSSGRWGSGILAYIPNGASVLQALALADTMNQWGDQPPILELYHNGTISTYVQYELEAYPFVRVVLISPPNAHMQQGDSSAFELEAIAKSHLKHIFLVKPSILFLQNPQYLVQTMEFIHRHNEECSCDTGACVTTTETSTADHLRSRADESKAKVLCHVRTAYQYSQPVLVSKPFGQVVATVVESTYSVGLWAYPSTTNLLWIRSMEPLPENAYDLVRTDDVSVGIPKEFYFHMRASWKAHVRGARLLLMDRKIDWAAFDGGLDLATMNSLNAAKAARKAGSSVLTIDLVTTADGELIAIHDVGTFFPDGFEGGDITTPISAMNSADAKKIRHPCIDQKVMRALHGSPYTEYSCNQDKMAHAELFLDEVQNKNVDLIFDLKDPTVEKQLNQALILGDMIKHRGIGKDKKISVRFFSAADTQLVASIMPEKALQSLASEPRIAELPYYVNVPSALACSQVTSWIHSNPSFLNKNIAGCFIVMHHERIQADWERFKRDHGLSTSVSRYDELSSQVQMICDVPRRDMDAPLLRNGFRHCVTEGFDAVHHPFRVSSGTGIEATSMLSTIPDYNVVGVETIRSYLAKRMTDSVWREYKSSWGFTFAYEWPARVEATFQGDTVVSSSSGSFSGIFRCVSKLFSAMLLLQLEERSLINLDERWNEMNNKTLFDIVTNAANVERGDFRYDNGAWASVPDIVRRATGMHFADAMRFYVLDPMGIVGTFNQNTTLPPYAARGFEGPLQDLLLVGSTLASGGISPKTHKQILSEESVHRMLLDSTLHSKKSFYEEPVTKSMKRFYHTERNSRVSMFPNGVVDGYGMGVWRVNGWRSGAQRDVRGWLSMGSSEALLYFDTTGLVVAMLAAKQVRTYELTPAFSQVVRELGDHIDEPLLHGNLHFSI